ncbi:YqeB family protein [Actinoplanes sp. CA-142083]|uniref:YqeB family protein n=1 Tax=Actinoplanes sp. CA-142083 TaxID=3239903 RepID=UPI003D8DD0AB
MLQQTTNVPTPWWARVLVWLCLPAIGAALLYLVMRVAVWLPLPGPFNLARELPEPAASITAAALGALLGLILAGLVDRESLTVRITLEEVVLTRPGTTATVPRPEVTVAFPDRDQLVLLGRTGRELAREPCHLSAGRLRAAFAANGIAWADQDPYLSSYRRWVPDLPDLPATAHALLAARQKALDAGDDADKRELRGELGRLGYVLRDERKRQYWRHADG